MRCEAATPTVPNILVMAADDESFALARGYIRSLLAADAYTVYKLNEAEFASSLVWTSNAKLLVALHANNNNATMTHWSSSSPVASYLKAGGRVLSIPAPSKTKTNDEVQRKIIDIGSSRLLDVYDSLYPFEPLADDVQVTPIHVPALGDVSEPSVLATSLYSYREDGGVHVVSKVSLEESSLVDAVYSQLFAQCFQMNVAASSRHSSSHSSSPPEQLSEAYEHERYELFTRNALTMSPSVVRAYLRDSLRSEATFEEKEDDKMRHHHFDAKLFFAHLDAKCTLGSVLLHARSLDSTMSTFRADLPDALGNALVVAQRQRLGQGNNRNEWLSPVGCCMFTLYMNNLTIDTFPPARLCLLQCAAALSCVKAVLDTPGHEVYTNVNTLGVCLDVGCSYNSIAKTK